MAEKRQKMRQVFVAAVALMVVALASLAVFHQWGIGLIISLGLYFIGFNLLEATIPSWISKKAPVANKATAMGLNSSSQFFGAFIGGALGGILLPYSPFMAWGILAVIMAVGLAFIFPIEHPPYLSSTTLSIPKNVDAHQWSQQLMAIDAIEDIVVMDKEGVAYLKIDKQRVDDITRQQMSQLTPTKLDI